MTPAYLVDTDWVIDHFSGIERVTRSVTLLPLDEPICDRFGLERGRLRQQRLTIGDFDHLIAATCLRHGLKLCSNNRRHFDMIGGLEISMAKDQRDDEDSRGGPRRPRRRELSCAALFRLRGLGCLP